MPLRDAPLPRMAGHLPFMRGPVAALGALRPGQVAAFGAGIGHGHDDASLEPLGLRETSSYFGSHFASNMKAAMDVDQRRVLDPAAVSGRLVDLGDIDFAHAGEPPADCVASLSAAVAARGAIPILLGGSPPLAEAMRRGLSEALKADVRAVGLRDALPEPAGRTPPLLAVLDLAEVASVWHGGSVRAGFAGVSLSQARSRLREIGSQEVVGAAVVGLDPARQGLSTVKTGQRLLVTALLDLIYARLDALADRETAHA